jgi:Fe-S cluster assembly scaffold protein SufB
MLRAYEAAGGKAELLATPRMASAVVSANRVLAVNEVAGVRINAQELPNGVYAHVMIAPWTSVAYPIHLCFGVLPSEGLQEIESLFEIGEGADVGFVAHCTFPNARDVRHLMHAEIRVGPRAIMRYSEAHYHGPYGGIEVVPTTRARVHEGGQLESDFSIVHGRVGRLALTYEVDVAAAGRATVTSKAYGSLEDEIQVTEVLRLNGRGARGLARTRAAVRDRATSRVTTTTEGNAPGTRGHMDCTEIVRDRATASNVPIVVVRDDQARVTHEAAIGSVGKKELETLMSRGLPEEKAVDVIIRGMLS